MCRRRPATTQAWTRVSTRTRRRTRSTTPRPRSPPPLHPMTEPGENPDGLAEGTLISHLLELRDRLLKAMLAVGICFIPCALYMNQLFTFVAEPLKRKLPAGAT